MGRLLRVLFGLGVVAALSACATGAPPATQAAVTIPAPPQGKARIVVYRTNSMGVIVQPAVKINGTPRGQCAPNVTFSVDVDPGAYEVSAATVGGSKVNVTLQAGQTVFISCRIGMGIVIGIPRLEVVSQAEGAAATARLKARASN